ncbi:Cytochrome P450 704C1 [Durusdinium trenchii]|uniref:Cytochrome P450 704C1 n=1 Tax=Durusdinium trenchii TaxID=1381693 RepID=A0ABP0M4B3_9DINO
MAVPLVRARCSASADKDAGVALGLSLLALIAQVVVRHVMTSSCESSLWIISLVVLILRFADFICGCCSIMRNPVPSRAGFLCDIFKNLVITFLQGIAALVQFILGITTVVQEGCALQGGIGIGSGILLGIQAAEESCIWTIVLCLWCVAGSSPVPGWCDKWVPERAKREARKHRTRLAGCGLQSGSGDLNGSLLEMEGAHGGFAAPHNLMKDELRDLSTRQPSGGSPARPDGPHRLANDGDTRQDHPHQYHFDMVAAAQASGLPQYVGASHWWVKLRRTARDPEVKLWTRDCCSEIYGRQLFVLLGNSSDVRHAAECAALEVLDDQQVSTICLGTGEYLFVEARPGRAEAEEVAILMLPEVRVLSRD